MKKKMFIAALATVMAMAMSMTAFADEWKSNDKGWWWEYTNGQYPTNCWKWIDGNGDGTVECYYFGADGYMLANTTTPDGYQVNADGAWVVNGEVQRDAFHAELGHYVKSAPGTTGDTTANPVTDGKSVQQITMNAELTDLVKVRGSLDKLPNKTEIGQGLWGPTYLTNYNGIEVKVTSDVTNGVNGVNTLYGPAKAFLNNIPEQGIEFNAFYDNFGYESLSTGRRPQASTGDSDSVFGLPSGSYRMLWCDVNNKFFSILLTEASDGTYYITPDSPMNIR